MEQMIVDVNELLSGMDWEEMSTLLNNTIEYLSDDQPIPSPPPPDPGLELKTKPEPVPVHSQVGGYDWSPPQRASPPIKTVHPMYNGECQVGTMQAGHLDGLPGSCGQGPIPAPPPPVLAWLELNTQPQHLQSQVGGYGGCQPGAYSQVQYLPYQWPMNGIPQPIPAAGHPVPPHTYNNVPVMTLPGGSDQNLQYVGVLNGETVYTLPAGVFPPPCVPAAPQPSASNSYNIKHDSQQEDDCPYIKRPPNAFLLFMKEHRPHVDEEIKRMGNGIVNTVLGQRWKSLSAEEQAKYYQQAEIEKQLHAQRHPGWSVIENYGKKRKTIKKRAPKASKRPCVSPVASTSRAAVMEASTSRAAVMEASTSRAAVMEASTSRAALMEASTSRAVLMEAFPSRAVLMEASTSRAVLMEASTSWAAVELCPLQTVLVLSATHRLHRQI